MRRSRAARPRARRAIRPRRPREYAAASKFVMTRCDCPLKRWWNGGRADATWVARRRARASGLRGQQVAGDRAGLAVGLVEGLERADRLRSEALQRLLDHLGDAQERRPPREERV